MGKLGESPMFKAITSAKDTRRPKDEHMSEHLTGIRHNLLSIPLNVRKMGPTSETDLICKNSAIDLNDHFKPKIGGSHTRVVDSVIMMTPPTRKYKRGRRLWCWGLEKLG